MATFTDPVSSSVQDAGGYPAKRLQRTVKQVLDFGCAAALLIVLSPLFLLIAACIKFDGEGPIFYRRRVVGQEGGFDAFKFRTMRADADAILAADPALRARFEQDFKLRDDPRVTRAGAVLRKYSLDELPQLLNVLKGEMSLVGPRMISPAELEKYGDFQKLLMKVKPGLTGYWQVNGRQRVSYEERVKMDVYYIEHWNLYIDLQILWKTPAKVIHGEGAY